MYRSGSTLQYQVASELVEINNLGNRVEWMSLDTLIDHISSINSQGYKVLKTHEINSSLEDFIKKNSDNVKILYIFRDLRDVFLSHMIKNNLSFDEVYKSDFLIKCINLYDRWTNLNNVYISRYEDVVNDLKLEVKRIAEFLKINIDEKNIDIISEKYSFVRQQERIIEINRRNMSSYGSLKFDKENLLHHNHLNKGEVGGWKNYFSREQIDMLNSKIGNWLSILGYEL